jgi:hypothetical protein
MVSFQASRTVSKNQGWKGGVVVKRHQYIGVFLIVIGCVIGIFSMLDRQTARPSNEDIPSSQSSDDPTRVLPKIDLVPKDPSVSQLPITAKQPTQTNATYIDYLLDRALREAEAAALRAAQSFRKEMMAPVQANDRSFAEKLYTIGANAKVFCKTEVAYRAYVAERFYEELKRNTDLQKNLDAVAFEYLDRLGRIAQQVAIESGRDVANLPVTTLTINDFDKVLRADISDSIVETASEIQKQTMIGTTVQAVSFGIGLLMPTPLLVDLAIGAGIEAVSNSFRDPEGQVAIEAHRAVEGLADRICFGTDQHQGLYSALLDIAHYQNEQLRETLTNSDSISGAESLGDFFKESDE